MLNRRGLLCSEQNSAGRDGKLEAGSLGVLTGIIGCDDTTFVRCRLRKREIIKRPVWHGLCGILIEDLPGQQRKSRALIWLRWTLQGLCNRPEGFLQSLILIHIFSLCLITPERTVNKLFLFAV